jgi:hypothetical protein
VHGAGGMNPPGAANRREGDRLPFASRGSARRIALPRLLFVGPRPSFTPCMDQRPSRGASADPRANRRGTRWRFGGPRSPSARHPWGGRDQVGPGEGLEPAFQNRGCARGLDVLLCDPGGSVAIGYDRLNSLRATPAGFEPAFMRRHVLTHTGPSRSPGRARRRASLGGCTGPANLVTVNDLVTGVATTLIYPARAPPSATGETERIPSRPRHRSIIGRACLSLALWRACSHRSQTDPFAAQKLIHLEALATSRRWRQ